MCLKKGSFLHNKYKTEVWASAKIHKLAQDMKDNQSH
jgi:hypothetical protein